MLTNFTTQYLPPILFVIIIALAGVLLLYWLSRRGTGTRVWQILVRYRGPLGFLFAVLLFVVAFVTFLVRSQATTQFQKRETQEYNTYYNLLFDAPLITSPLTATLESSKDHINAIVKEATIFNIAPQASLMSPMIPVRPGLTYSYSFFSDIAGDFLDATGQVSLIWFDHAHRVIAWNDAPEWKIEGDIAADYKPEFQTGKYEAPSAAAYLRLQIRNLNPLYDTEPETSSNTPIQITQPKLSQQGIYIEPHPNAASGSIAFSFDWESAMGGAVHSKGDEIHDVAGAEQHGLEMREGGNWLNNLFVTNNISATFYSTGYNLLDGNTEKHTFNGDPTYTWAAPKNGWESEYWLTHKWFSDDPFGTYETNPAWYFGDQTRRLLAAGHEIAPHTFAHVYVRGATPEELATDLDEWIKYAALAGVPPPTTFAFPWRSSNSLTKEFYDVFYSRGIRVVTRIYAPDMKDLYTLGNVVVYTDIAQAQLYHDMPVMPDFLLGSPSDSAGEEAGGAPISREQGLDVLSETVARRGTTSFWQHPEQLADGPVFDVVRQAWTDVVEEAARLRDQGKLWIDTVAEITQYQRDVMSITATLKPPGIFGGKWQVEVSNNSGKELAGVTLTLPGEAASASDQAGTLQSVARTGDSTTMSEPGKFAGPSRQVVLAKLAPGTITIEIEWVKGQEPPR